MDFARLGWSRRRCLPGLLRPMAPTSAMRFVLAKKSCSIPAMVRKAYRYASIAEDGPVVAHGQWVAVHAWPDQLSTISGIARQYGWG